MPVLEQGTRSQQASHPSVRRISPEDKITTGILSKYVNLGKGWRRRLFVVQNSTVRYYKVDGPHKINVHSLLEGLRRQGTLVLVGAELPVLEGKTGLRKMSSSFKAEKTPEAHAEAELKGAQIQLSETDNRKFYVIIGDLYLRMRAESKDDKDTWYEAFAMATGSTSAQRNMLGGESMLRYNENELSGIQNEASSELRRLGAGDSVQQYVLELLAKQHDQYRSTLAMESHKRHDLVHHMKDLEDERRVLETTLVVEQMNNRQESGDPRLADDATSDGEESDAAGRGSVSDSGDEFFDCNATLPRGGAGGGDADGLASPDRADSGDTASTSQDGRLGASLHTSSPGGRGSIGPGGLGASLRKSSVGVRSTSTGLPENGEAHPQRRYSDHPDWLEAEMPPPKRRSSMPKPAQAERSVSLWSIIKECVGKDLSKVCLPVFFNEPTSALQKICEELEYSKLLDEAAALPKGSQERLIKVAAFAISGYSGTAGRLSKPFNPLLGETYEFVCAEQGFRFIAEKVVHHPTVIAAYAEGRKWTFQGDVDLKSKFWGRSIELMPVGSLLLDFHDGDQYVWHKVNSSINNLIVGKMYIDHSGVMRIRNTATGLTAKLKFHDSGMFNSKDNHAVKGGLEENGQKVAGVELAGKWDQGLKCIQGGGPPETIWEVNPPPANPTRYNLTGFVMKLNELTPGLQEKLAPTDCRLRPDQRATELGRYDEANAEKQRLEHKQRAARRAADRGDPIKPRWFHKNEANAGDNPDDLTFVYKGGYFESRAKRSYEGCRDIFGPDVADVPA